MKKIYLTAVTLIALLFAVLLYSNSYSNLSDDHNCKCCDESCVQNQCCTGSCGSAQGENKSCCTDKCTSEKCKECCAQGNCNMMNDTNKSGSNETMNMPNDKSCCKNKADMDGCCTKKTAPENK